MAGYSWSNPNPSDQTGAALGSQFRVQADNIAPLIAAIIAQREHKAAQERQALMQIAQGVAGAYGGYQQAQQAGLADDAANRAIYQARYPGDPYSGQAGYDERVPDYGGTMGYQAQINADKLRQIEEKLNGTGWQNDLQRKLVEARINAINAKAGQGTTGDSNIYNDDAVRRGFEPSNPYTPPRGLTPNAQLELEKRIAKLEADATVEERANIAAEKPGVPFSRQKELNQLRAYRDAAMGQVPQAQSDNPRDYPQVGEIRKGYRFKGGDPADRNNWEKI